MHGWEHELSPHAGPRLPPLVDELLQGCTLRHQLGEATPQRHKGQDGQQVVGATVGETQSRPGGSRDRGRCSIPTALKPPSLVPGAALGLLDAVPVPLLPAGLRGLGVGSGQRDKRPPGSAAAILNGDPVPQSPGLDQGGPTVKLSRELARARGRDDGEDSPCPRQSAHSWGQGHSRATPGTPDPPQEAPK